MMDGNPLGRGVSACEPIQFWRVQDITALDALSEHSLKSIDTIIN
jgi:hypothetical protein